MEPSADKLLDACAAMLRSHLSRPLRLDAETAGFVSATYGDTEAETLKTLVAATDTSDTETLLELLLFPGIDFQLHLEALLKRFQGVRLSQQQLRASLSQPRILIELALAEGDATIRFPLPDDFLERFLNRLNLTKRWPANIEDALHKHLPADDHLRARVLLRNGPTAMGDTFAELFAALVKALPHRHRDFWPALELVIQLAPELDAGEPPFELLTGRKQRAFQMVEQQREFEYRLQRSNIEILMGQGLRAPTLARSEARRQMRVIDAVCQAAYGKTTYFQPAVFE